MRIRTLVVAATLTAFAAPAAHATPRERAIEQIPELMGRILESQEEIHEREQEVKPLVERYDKKLDTARSHVEHASSEDDAAEALVDYVEAYAARLDAQEQGLRSIEPAVVRMRADARELARAARDAGGSEPESPAARREFFAEQFQGVALGMGSLAERLGREEDAGTAGALLQASWASHQSRELPLQELGSDGALAFSSDARGPYGTYHLRPGEALYSAVVVRGVRVGPSPEWLTERLAAVEVRPINNIVDVTNFVLWETGQPLHAFDLAKVSGNRIVVRRVFGERGCALEMAFNVDVLGITTVSGDQWMVIEILVTEDLVATETGDIDRLHTLDDGQELACLS